jgi:negative regulator of replication initiation
MANVTIKDVDEEALNTVARRAADLGMSAQEFLRRLITQEAARPVVPNELAALGARLRAQRQPMPMKEFNRVRRTTMRSS